MIDRVILPRAGEHEIHIGYKRRRAHEWLVAFAKRVAGTDIPPRKRGGSPISPRQITKTIRSSVINRPHGAIGKTKVALDFLAAIFGIRYQPRRRSDCPPANQLLETATLMAVIDLGHVRDSATSLNHYHCLPYT